MYQIDMDRLYLLQMMDRKAVMASDELSGERIAEWVRSADAVFQFVKVLTFQETTSLF